MTTVYLLLALFAGLVTLWFWKRHHMSTSMAFYLFMVIGIAVFFLSLVEAGHERKQQTGRSDLTLCLKFTNPIESSQRRALKTLPTLAYYKEHPEELASQIAQIKAYLKVFAARTCYDLPSVKEAGLKPPVKKTKGVSDPAKQAPQHTD